MIFISYSWKDETNIIIVEAALKRLGLKYWIDKKNLNLNKRLCPQISTAIYHSDQLLCIGSKASRKSPWVQYEIRIASNLGKKIYELDANHDSLKPKNACRADKLLSNLLTMG